MDGSRLDRRLMRWQVETEPPLDYPDVPWATSFWERAEDNPLFADFRGIKKPPTRVY